MSVSKRLRYEVLRRDNHTCRYCGAKAPDVKITVDHVVPVALGGSDDPTNLVAACDACNGGKTSSTPDAPVVANVSEDALRWSRALTIAAQQMHDRLAEREDIFDAFEEIWGNWTYGFDKKPIPRPANWRSSIDSFLAAGLTPEVLRSCVETAMGSQAKPVDTWRYMCGVAWRRVNELQDAARIIVSGSDDAAGEDDGGWEMEANGIRIGRKEMSLHLLRGALSDREVTLYLNGAQGDLGEGDPGIEEAAASRAFADLIGQRRSLIRALGQMLRKVEGGEEALAAACAWLQENLGAPPGDAEWHCLAVRILADNEPVRVGDIL